MAIVTQFTPVCFSALAQVRCAEASVGLGKPAAALECLARALVLEPTNSKARELIAALRRDHSPDVLGEVSLETMTRLRKRAAAQAERGAQQQADAYVGVIKLLAGDVQQVEHNHASSA